MGNFPNLFEFVLLYVFSIMVMMFLAIVMMFSEGSLKCQNTLALRGGCLYILRSSAAGKDIPLSPEFVHVRDAINRNYR